MIEVLDVHKRYQTDHGPGPWVLRGVQLQAPLLAGTLALVPAGGASQRVTIRNMIGDADGAVDALRRNDYGQAEFMLKLSLSSDLDKLIATAMACDGAILGSRVRDTMKRTDGAGNIVATVEREQLWHALTPQMFPTGTLKRALEEGLALGALITDEASAMERAGFTVKMVEGRADNIKVTRPEDLSLAELFLQQQSARQQARPD